MGVSVESRMGSCDLCDYVRVWEGKQFVHEWVGRVRKEISVRTNRQSDYSPGGGGVSTHIWLIPSLLQLWALLLFVVLNLALFAQTTSTQPQLSTVLLRELSASFPYFCALILCFFMFYFQAKSEQSSRISKYNHSLKPKSDFLFVHKRNCVCPLCTWNFKFVEEKEINWRGGIEETTYTFSPQPERPYQKDVLIVRMDWTLQTLEVISMLLILAGDIETNPGPTYELTLHTLDEELRDLTKPIQFGVKLGIPQREIEVIQANNPNDVLEQKIELLKYIAKNYKSLEITWEKIADSLDSLSVHDLAQDIRTKFCHSETKVGYGTPNKDDNNQPGAHFTDRGKPTLDTVTPSSPDDTSSEESSVKQTYLRFVCGCGKCTVVDYASGKKCPNQKQLPFPKLGFSEIQSDAVVFDIDIFEQTLLKQSREMHSQFTDIMFDTSKTLNQREVDFEDVKHYLELLFEPDWHFVSKHGVAPSEVLINLCAVENFRQLTSYLQKNYCSWYNYELIKRLRKKFLFKFTEDELMTEYEHLFEEYVRRRCYLFLDDVGPNSTNRIEVMCKVDIQFTEISQDLIGHLKLEFSTIIGISKYHLTFKEAREGCTELLFRAPTFIKKLTKLSAYQVEKLKAHDFLEVRIDNQEIYQMPPLKAESISSLEESEAGETGLSTGEEADVDTTDFEIMGSHLEMFSYHNLMKSDCKKEIKFLKEVCIDAKPCTLWKAIHDGVCCIVIKHNGEADDRSNFFKYTEDLLHASDRYKNSVKVSCIHEDEKAKTPLIVLEAEQTFREYCFSNKSLTNADQLSLLHGIALGFISINSTTNACLIVTEPSLFVRKTRTGEQIAVFCPLYNQSYFPLAVPESTINLDWLKIVLIQMHYCDQLNENSELPEDHFLYSILTSKWLSRDKLLCANSMEDVAKDIQLILEWENIQQGQLDALSNSEVLEVSHLHMILIGHTGVGKTSVRKHLQNIPFDKKEKSTTIMDQELLYQEIIEASTDCSSMVFQKMAAVYKSDPDKVFLTLWDTGGQPMFQDLLPCFAKLRLIYGIVFRICDLMENSRAVIRPTSSLEPQKYSPFTWIDYVHRCLAFLELFSLDVKQSFGDISDEVRNSLFDSNEKCLFPKVVLIGTHKDAVKTNQLICLRNDEYKQFSSTLKSSSFSALAPSSECSVFEIDNTRSGGKQTDLGIGQLREQLITCAQGVKARIPSKWINFKVELEQKSHLQQPCTGVLSFEKAVEISAKYEINPKAALCYFHEIGIFLWYHRNETLQEYVIIEPKNLLSVLGTIMNPEKFICNYPEEWKNVKESGILHTELGIELLKANTTGLPLMWVLSFLEEHRLVVSLDKGYFIPSMLQVLPVCHSHWHVFDISSSSCEAFPSDPTAAPLFLVSKSKYIPPGFFPRLMTLLAGVKQQSLVWKLSTCDHCKNMVSFSIDDKLILIFTEFKDCVRIHFTSHLPDKNILQKVCKLIVSVIQVQLQRLFIRSHKQLVWLTFACTCCTDNHFLPSLPLATDEDVRCYQYPGQSMKLTTAHKIWLTEEKESAPIASIEDAQKIFDEAMKGKALALHTTTVVFSGLSGSDISACKRTIMDNNATPFDSPHYLSGFQSGIAVETSYYIVSNGCMRLLEDAHLDTVFANNAVTSIKFNDDMPSNDSESNTLQSDEAGSSNSAQPPLQGQSTEQTEPELPLGSDTGILYESEITSANKVGSYRQYKALDKEALTKCTDSTTILKRIVKVSDSEENLHLELIKCVSISEIWLLQILPMFCQDISLGINCVNFSHTLEEAIFLEHFHDEVIGDQVASLTNMQVIDQLSSISTKVMVISSHSEFEANESAEEKSVLLLDHPASAKIIMNETKAIFEINTNRADLQEISSIQEKVVSLSSLSESKLVSLPWHRLGQIIKNIMKRYNKKMISVQEVLIAASEFQMKNKDFEIALLNLHTCGLIAYYGSVLPNVVFDDCSVLLDLLVEIKKSRARQSHQAVLTLDDFKRPEAVYVTGLFMYKEAISLLKYLHIISDFKQLHFLMPCILTKSLSEEELPAYCKEDVHIAPLVIQYSALLGIFEYMVCYLTSQQNQSPWPWEICDRRVFSPQPVCLYKNCVQFRLPGVNTLITLLKTDQITLYVNSVHDTELLPVIKRAVVTGISKAYAAFHHSRETPPVIGLYCRCSKVNFKHMIVSTTEDQWICSVSKESIVLSNAEKCWFNVSHNGMDYFNVQNTFARLFPWSKDWYKIGMSFGVGINTLQGISAHYRHNSKSALLEVIKCWFENHRNPTWAAVQQVILHLQAQILEGEVLVFLQQEYSMQKKIFIKCFPLICLCVNMTCLLPYLLKYSLVESDEIDTIYSPYLSNSTKLMNLFKLTEKNGELGFALLYKCLYDSRGDHHGHVYIVNKLRSEVTADAILDILKVPRIDSEDEVKGRRMEGEELEMLIKQISDNIGLEWCFLARSLGFTQTDIDGIEYANPRNLREQIYQFFYQWKRRDGTEATSNKLYAALVDTSLTTILEPTENMRFKGESLSTSHPDSFNVTTDSRNQSESGSVPASAPPESSHASSSLSIFGKDSESPTTSVNDLNVDAAEYVRRRRLERFKSNWSNISALSGSSSSDIQEWSSSGTSSFSEKLAVSSSSLQQPPHAHPLSCSFELDDMVMVERPDAAPWYGVIRWIGELPERQGVPVAGIEMEDEVPGGGDGSMNGLRLFHCLDRHGLFLPVTMIKRDTRFSTSQNSDSSRLPELDSMLQKFALSNVSPDKYVPEIEKVLVFTVPADCAGLVIGRDGRNIREVELATNTIIKMERDYGPGLGGNKRGVIRGSEENQKKALQMILNRLKKRVDLHTARVETVQIPEDKVGLVIGRGGQTINAIKTLSGVVDIKIDDRLPGLASFSLFAPSTRSCTITGSEKDIEKAKQLIDLAVKGGNIVVGDTLAALIADLANLGVEVEECSD